MKHISHKNRNSGRIKMELKDSYYSYNKSIGVDYNYYGNWQKEYAKCIISISNIMPIAANYQKSSTILDVGTACGVNLKAFKELKVFKNHIGIDSDEYMIELGKKTHGFTNEELKVVDITKEKIPLEDNSVIFINCSQILEHIEEQSIDFILEEFERILDKENGIILINVPILKSGQKEEEILEENKKHISKKNYNWWRKKISKYFRKIDNQVNLRFKEDNHSPNNSKNTFYDYYNQTWTFFQASETRR